MSIVIYQWQGSVIWVFSTVFFGCNKTKLRTFYPAEGFSDIWLGSLRSTCNFVFDPVLLFTKLRTIINDFTTWACNTCACIPAVGTYRSPFGCAPSSFLLLLNSMLYAFSSPLFDIGQNNISVFCISDMLLIRQKFHILHNFLDMVLLGSRHHRYSFVPQSHQELPAFLCFLSFDILFCVLASSLGSGIP